MPAITTESGRVETFRAMYWEAKQRLASAEKYLRETGRGGIEVQAAFAAGRVDAIAQLAADLGIDLAGDES